jgi:NDP-sugar pyrophosphorylase family protein
MAAGLGQRLAPLSDRWPKPVLPIDGRPVIVTLVHELAGAGVERLVVVTGHFGEQIEALLAPLPYDVRFARQPEALGSADAVVRAGATAPFLVAAADTRFGEGDIGRFVAAARTTAGAVAVRRQSGRPDHTRTHVENGRVVQVVAPKAPGGFTGAPLWWLGPEVASFLEPLPGKPPYELGSVMQLAIDAGVVVSAIQVGRTRDLTTPFDVVHENFPYLR